MRKGQSNPIVAAMISKGQRDPIDAIATTMRKDQSDPIAAIAAAIKQP